MKRLSVELSGMHFAEIDSFLAQKIYEFNAQETGMYDGEEFAGAIRNTSGEIVAGVSGYMWGGCCQVSHLGVHKSHRFNGLGSSLMRSVEKEARRKGCAQVVLSTHSFQSPKFYERLGYRAQAIIDGYPNGHANIHFIKMLTPANGA